jgi:hypothetical protein
MQDFQIVITLTVRAPSSCDALDFGLDLATLAETAAEGRKGVTLENLARTEVHPVVGVAA